MSPRLPARTLWFSLICGFSLLLFRECIGALLSLAWGDERYTYIVLMPLMGLGLLYMDRARVFARADYRPWLGVPLLFASLLIRGAVWRSAPNARTEFDLRLEALALILFWLAGFIVCHGTRAFRAALFPMFLLLLTIPPPAASMRWAEVALQHASADVSYVILKLTGTPVFRHGLVFSLPGMDIEVARECSGIRSTTALLITAILAGHLLLRASWSKACLVLLAIPVSIFKNAVRIATLSWLGVYVNPEVLHGELHRYGGLPFTLLALGLLVPLLLGLMRLEERWLKGQTAVSGPA